MTSKAGISGASLVTLLLLWGQLVSGQYQGPIAALTPPAGNSPKIALRSKEAVQVYACVNGNWTFQTAYAKLVDATTGQVVGNYTSVADEAGPLISFALFNSRGDFLESADAASIVRARTIVFAADAASPVFLLEAVSHENMGRAAAVSYIQIYNIVADFSPVRGSCSAGSQETISFTAQYSLYVQDPLPAAVPKQLQPAGRVIDGFFGEGNITFRYDGSAWTEVSRAGSLQNSPGTPVLGQFWQRNGVQSWQIYDPNGFTVYAKQDSPSMVMSSTGTAWTLSRVTSTPTSRWSLGKFSDVQTTSTRGGLAPNNITASQLYAGLEFNSEFSAIYWFYTNDFPLITPGN